MTGPEQMSRAPGHTAGRQEGVTEGVVTPGRALPGLFPGAACLPVGQGVFPSHTGCDHGCDSSWSLLF